MVLLAECDQEQITTCIMITSRLDMDANSEYNWIVSDLYQQLHQFFAF